MVKPGTESRQSVTRGPALNGETPGPPAGILEMAIRILQEDFVVK